MNRVVWKKVSWQKRRGMRSLSLSSPVASSSHTQTHTHTPHFINSNNSAPPYFSPKAPYLFLFLTLPCPDSNYFSVYSYADFFSPSPTCQSCIILLNSLLPHSSLSLLLLSLQVESNHHIHHRDFSAPHITITTARTNSLPCSITLQFFFLPPSLPPPLEHSRL